jgi:hypothetical protein
MKPKIGTHKVLFAFAALIVMAACSNKQTDVLVAEGDKIGNEVAFEVAKNYFFKNGQEIPASPKITTAEDFGKLFGMATTMGEDGKPTPIDFSKHFVLAIVHPVTDYATEIKPVKVTEKGDSLFYTFEVNKGEKQTYSIKPISIIILDKKYENKEVVLLEEKSQTTE